MADRWVERWQVEGTTGTYTVSRDKDGNFGCACATWKFKKGKKVDCQHILRKRIELMQFGSLSTTEVKVVQQTKRIVRLGD